MNPFLDNIQIEETFFDDDLEQQCFIDDYSDDGESLFYINKYRLVAYYETTKKIPRLLYYRGC